MPDDPRFDDLHDATLDSVEWQWQPALAHIQLRTGHPSAPHVVITVHGVRRLEGTQLLHWGHSISVNTVFGPAPTVDALAQRMEIQMQSGDTIVLEGARFERKDTEAPDGPAPTAPRS